MEKFKSQINLIEIEIDKYINSLGDNSIYDSVKYFLKLPSKRVRPLFTLLTNALYNNNHSFAIPAALSNEMFHNFTLLHDDIMDSSKKRRGFDTVHEKWNVNQAILSGDSILIMATKFLDFYESKIQKDLLKLFNSTALEVCEGQQLDMEFENKINIDFDDYIDMITKKTSVLIASSIKMGGIINELDKDELNCLYDIGLNLGIAFQIQDDYLDLFGDEKIIGKKVGLDVINNKKTALHHLFVNKASKTELSKYQDYMLLKNNYEKVEKIKSLLSKNNTDKSLKNLVEDYSNKADSIIQKLTPEFDQRPNLILLSEFLLKRNY
ncbi:polyprenyl synthetase family protein [Flavobacteriales bacterium]|nr:polyprenyl synthetase family protein [Flavobacteriales bacterium]